MKKMILLSSLFTFAAASADTTQVVQDDLIKESSEVLKCETVAAPVVSNANVEIRPALPNAATAPTVLEEERTQPSARAEATVVEVPLDEIAPKELSPSEKLKVYRTKLEEKNRILLEKKLELIRLEQEMALLRNLERSMDKTINAIKEL